MEAPDRQSLCPAQRRALESLLAARGSGHVFVLHGEDGNGVTTVARVLARELEAAWLDAKDLLEALKDAHPFSVEDQWCQAILGPLRERRALVVDDFDGAAFLTGSYGCSNYPRAGFLDVGLRAICDEARALGAWLLFVGHGGSHVLGERALPYGVGRFTQADQEFLWRAAFGETACAGLDFAKLFRFAPRLTARQIVRAGRFVPAAELSTDRLIEYLAAQDLVTNVDLGQVEPVALSDLHGVDEVVRKLETHIILPLENDALARRLALTPRRGVLLYGPPGTGKTTVGRALAHRLRSKFFRIDGTFISGSSAFYNQVFSVIEHAKRNAPAVVFVDDSDVIFEAGEETGFYRYLLTILDGIESEDAGRLTVMLTAMDLAHLPPALIRSGRVELWLEMRLPDEAARRRILADRLRSSIPEPVELDLDGLAAATPGFTGADLRRLVEDAKNAWAYAIASGSADGPGAHFLQAAREIAESRERLGEAQRRATAHFAQRRPRPAWAPDWMDLARLEGGESEGG